MKRRMSLGPFFVATPVTTPPANVTAETARPSRTTMPSTRPAIPETK